MDEHNNIHMFSVERNVSHCVSEEGTALRMRLHATGNGNASPKHYKEK